MSWRGQVGAIFTTGYTQDLRCERIVITLACLDMALAGHGQRIDGVPRQAQNGYGCTVLTPGSATSVHVAYASVDWDREVLTIEGVEPWGAAEPRPSR